jgi:hypothetical protein
MDILARRAYFVHTVNYCRRETTVSRFGHKPLPRAAASVYSLVFVVYILRNPQMIPVWIHACTFHSPGREIPHTHADGPLHALLKHVTSSAAGTQLLRPVKLISVTVSSHNYCPAPPRPRAAPGLNGAEPVACPDPVRSSRSRSRPAVKKGIQLSSRSIASVKNPVWTCAVDRLRSADRWHRLSGRSVRWSVL